MQWLIITLLTAHRAKNRGRAGLRAEIVTDTARSHSPLRPNSALLGHSAVFPMCRALCARRLPLKRCTIV
eukprot:7379697-Prymnesium_polylepis.1